MSDAPEPITRIKTPVQLDYLYSAGQSATRFLKGIAEGKLLGQRCPVDGKVYFPTRGACPSHGVPTSGELVELPDTGTVVTFCITRVPSESLDVPLPYVSAHVLVDGADTTFFHILDCPVEEARLGMRVKAVWRPKEEWSTSLQNIIHFAPSGEPDAPFDSFKEHL